MFKDGQFTKELPNNQGDYYDDQCTNRIDKHICNLHFWIDVIQSDCSKEHVNIINIQSSFRNKRDMCYLFFWKSLLKSNEENSTKIPMHIKTVPIFKYPFLKDSPVHLKVPTLQILGKEIPQKSNYNAKNTVWTDFLCIERLLGAYKK